MADKRTTITHLCMCAEG